MTTRRLTTVFFSQALGAVLAAVFTTAMLASIDGLAQAPAAATLAQTAEPAAQQVVVIGQRIPRT